MESLVPSMPTSTPRPTPPAPGHSTTTGHRASSTTERLTEPRIQLPTGPLPRDPSTSSEAWPDAATSAGIADPICCDVVTSGRR